MLLTEARRPARSTAGGALVPLADQDRADRDRGLVAEGTSLAAVALERGPMGEYTVQAAVAALHDAAPRYEDTDWERILSLYSHLERMTDNPVVRLNRAVAVAMVEGPDRRAGAPRRAVRLGPAAHARTVSTPFERTCWKRRGTSVALGSSTSPRRGRNDQPARA